MSSIKVLASDNYDTKSLESLYETVFTDKQTQHFFLSKTWIINWLRHAKTLPSLITFEYNNKTLGFAFLGRTNSFLGDIYWLNQTGYKNDDQVWIEFNDVICQSEHQACRDALLTYLAKQKNVFQFACVNAQQKDWQSPAWQTWSIDANSGFACHFEDKALTQLFSKNTKSQISRSKSFIEKELGNIEMTWIKPDQVNQSVEEMSSLHIKKWGSHRYGSGFTNQQFVDFHKQLIGEACQTYAPIAKFTAGEQTLGYLYFFLHRKKVYFYLSAINYCLKNNKFKPGLLMHNMAMEYFKNQNVEVYDFLAGYARYKSSLSNQEYQLFAVKLYSNRWYYRPFKFLVNIKRKMLSTK